MSEQTPAPSVHRRPADETIVIRLTADDHVDFNLYHGRWQLAVLFLIYWCLLSLAATFGGFVRSTTDLAIAIPAAFVFSALLLALQWWRIKVRTRKLFAGERVVKVEQRIALIDEGIRHTAQDATVVVPWQDVFKVAESSRSLFVYLSRNKVIIVPKRVLTDVSEVKRVLQQHLPAQKLRLQRS